MAYYLIVLYIFVCVDIFKNGLSEVLYMKNTRFSGDVNDILDSKTYEKFDRVVTSSLECAVLCSVYACDTFYYDVTSGNCRYVMFMTKSAEIPSSPIGMENYIKVCKSGWLEHGKYCILFSKTKATWTDAKRKCEQMGSKLISLQSAEMNDFIVKTDFGHDAWVGARKTDVWRWEDNSAVIDVKSTNWASNNPNGSGKCMQLWRNRDNKWDDHYCDIKEHFICQATIDLF